MLSSKGVTLPTSARESQPSGNTKKDKIQQTPSSAKKNKVEAYLRNVKTNLQNKKGVFNTKNIASMQESKLNVNSDFQCVTCLGVLLSRGMGFLRGTLAVVVILVKGHTFPTIVKVLPADFGCSKHMIGDRSQLTIFINKFLDLKVAFRQHTSFIRNLEETKSWLWHQRLSHLNFDAINHLARQGLVRGLPKLKFKKDHLCSACAMGKSKNKSHKPKSKDTNQEKLYLLHIDLCGPIRVESVNGKNPGPALHEMTPATISSGLVPKPTSLTPVDPPAPVVIALIAEVIAPEPAESTGSPSSTTVDHDTPSPNALTQSFWIKAMQEELNEFERLEVWELVPQTDKVMVITLKLEAIRIFLTYAPHKNMVVYQMDVKTAFLNGNMREEISQSPRDIFINQLKYSVESLNKYGFESCDPLDTPIVEKFKLDEDKEGKAIDPSHYCDIFTKALGRERIEFLINKLGMRSFTPETLKQLTDEAYE
nr:hypothetical protein [Tanacetum cinerariifolium]